MNGCGCGCGCGEWIGGFLVCGGGGGVMLRTWFVDGLLSGSFRVGERRGGGSREERGGGKRNGSRGERGGEKKQGF